MCGAAALRAEFQFSDPDWAFEAQFAAKPTPDVVLTPSPQGDVKASRFFLEQAGERTMLIRFAYPMAMLPGEELGVYDKSIAELTRSRPGQVTARERYRLGPFEGQRLVISQPKEKTIRELRLLVAGSSLYVLSAEWPAGGVGETRARSFFGSIRLRPEYTDLRVVEERERWRMFSAGNFRLRYDASRWYRDPGDQEPGVFNLLRLDQKAEAQLITEDHPLEGGDIEKAVLDAAREGAESVSVKKKGKKLRGAAQVIELEFNARVENMTYVNHGYFYTGAEGAVQLRAWAKDNEYRDVSGDISELLDGLAVGGK